MSDLNLKLNRTGMAQLLRDPAVGQRLLEMGERVAAAASGHPSVSHPGEVSDFTAELHRGARVSVHVYPSDNTARFADPYHHWLGDAMGQGGL